MINSTLQFFTHLTQVLCCCRQGKRCEPYVPSLLKVAKGNYFLQFWQGKRNDNQSQNRLSTFIIKCNLKITNT